MINNLESMSLKLKSKAKCTALLFFMSSGIPFDDLHANGVESIFNTTAEYRILHNQSNVLIRVIDEQGHPIAGASISVLNDAKGVTDQKGELSLANLQAKQRLTISMLGYEELIIEVGNEGTLVGTLIRKEEALDEIVVVGYGTQKKRDVIGAVSQISSKDLEDRANSNVVKSIQGTMPGVNVTMRDGKASRGAVPTIRGVANSIGSGGTALVLIDGVEGDMATINPSDVETISVLKDASSAAVYGARGAFGVILITTKAPKAGVSKISYNHLFSVNERTVKWEDQIITDGKTWVDNWYEAYQGAYDYATAPNGINNMTYNADWHQELLRTSANPDLYPYRVVNGKYEYFGSTNWLDLFYKDLNFSKEHNLNIEGGNENSSYFLSGRYYDQDGIYKVGNEDYKQYNVRGKGKVNIKPWLSIENNTSLYKRTYHQPMLHYNNQIVQRQIEHEGQPVSLVTNPDGSWTRAAVLTGYAGFAEGTSWQRNDKLDIINSTSVNLDVIKDILVVKGDFNYKGIRSRRERLENMYDFNTGPNTKARHNTYNSYEVIDYVTNYYSANVAGTYTPKLGDDHTLKVLLGWNIENNDYTTNQTYRRGLLYPQIPSFTLMDGDYYTTTSGGYSWGFVGAFFRTNYSYKDKYLLEVSGRYDGSSKFPSDKRFGLFPSASLGWVVSKENFMQPLSNTISNMKIRASAGSLGNGQIDPYSYLETMDIRKSSVIIDGVPQAYTNAPNLIPAGLTWEKVTTYNVGLDMDFWGNKMNFVGDYYVRNTTDMFTVGPNLPQVLGSAAPYGNNADLQTKGWELSLGWNDRTILNDKPLNFSFKAMLWDSRTTITKYFNEDGDITTYYEGMEVGDIWGFRVAGLFGSNEEAAYWSDQSFFNSSSSRQLLAGDLKFYDINNDGKVNRGNQTLSNPGDMEVIGNSSPRYQYGFTAAGDWNNFGVSIFLQGIGKKDWYPYPETDFFWGMYGRPYGYLLNEHVGKDVWTEENPNTEAYWPRVRGYAANRTVGPMSLPNDRYLQDVSYLRVKNITLNYTLPKTLVNKIGLQNIRFNLSGENLFVFSNLFKHTKSFDPEVIQAGDTDFRSTRGVNNDGEGYSYPMLRTFTAGVNLTL